MSCFIMPFFGALHTAMMRPFVALFRNSVMLAHEPFFLFFLGLAAAGYAGLGNRQPLGSFPSRRI